MRGIEGGKDLKLRHATNRHLTAPLKPHAITRSLSTFKNDTLQAPRLSIAHLRCVTLHFSIPTDNTCQYRKLVSPPLCYTWSIAISSKPSFRQRSPITQTVTVSQIRRLHFTTGNRKNTSLVVRCRTDIIYVIDRFRNPNA